eukprot:jgi/Psemu1/287864/fgenesh1_pg.217_\
MTYLYREEEPVMVLRDIDNGVFPQRSSRDESNGKKLQNGQVINGRHNMQSRDPSRLYGYDFPAGTKNGTTRGHVETPPHEHMHSSSKRPVISRKPLSFNFRDRIEHARSPSTAWNVEKKVCTEEKDKGFKRAISAQSYIASPKGWTAVNEPDRIECTRNEIDQAVRTKRDEYEKIVFARRHDTLSMTTNQFGCHQSNPQDTPFQSDKPEISSPQRSYGLGPNTACWLNREEFESLRIEYSEYVRRFFSENDNTKSTFLRTKNRMKFIVRNRQLQNHEFERGEVPIIDVPRDSSTTMALYEANLLQDRMAIDYKIHLFRFDAIFSETASTEDFYSQTVRPNVTEAINGGLGTTIVFGPDENGKSRTITDIEQRTAFDLFSDPLASNRSVSIKYMGIGFSGNKFVDLIGPIHNKVNVVELHGNYQTEGALQIEVSSAKHFLNALRLARQRLASRSILQQEREAASYLLCEIRIRDWKGTSGCLYLLQCPSGHEVRSAEKDKSLVEYNPLASLMEMLRNKSLIHNLSLSCALTRLLASSIIASEQASVCLVATVSPSSVNTEATLSTLLSSREYMREIERNHDGWSDVELGKTHTREENDLMLPRQWSGKRLMEWAMTKKLLDKKIEGGLTGNDVMKMSMKQLKESFFNAALNGDKKASRLFNALRAENDRVARLRVKRKFALQKSKK